MTDPRLIRVLADQDQRRAAYRDYAQECRLAYDEFVRALFTPEQAMELVHRLLDGVEVTCAST